MKRKILYPLFFLSILILYFFTFNFFNSSEAVSTFKQYSSPSYKITKSDVVSYLNGNGENQEAIEYNIKKTILNNLGYEKWQEYIDYIELKLYVENVVHNNTPQLIAVLNLSKDLATVVIFEEANNEYIYKDKLENLCKIKEIKFLDNEIFNQDLMLIHQEIDEYFGAFFYKELLDMYVYSNNSFLNLWEQTTYFEESYKESWINPNDNSDRWNRIIEKTEIKFDFSDKSKINTYTEQLKYSAFSTLPPDKNAYTLEDKYTFSQSYYWSNKYKSFILGEASKETFLTDVALIKDMNISVERLFGINNKNLKVLSKSGEVSFLNRNKFSNIFQNHK